MLKSTYFIFNGGKVKMEQTFIIPKYSIFGALAAILLDHFVGAPILMGFYIAMIALAVYMDFSDYLLAKAKIITDLVLLNFAIVENQAKYEGKASTPVLKFPPKRKRYSFLFPIEIIQTVLMITDKGNWFLLEVHSNNANYFNTTVSPISKNEASSYLNSHVELHSKYFGEPQCA